MTDQAKELSSEEYYHGLLPREDMNSLLRRNGDFLVRFSEARKGQEKSFIVSVMVKETEENGAGIKHYIIKKTGGNKFMIEKFAFPSIKAMISHHVTRKDSLLKASDSAMLTNPIKRQDWEHQHEDVTLTKKIGEGAFGEVHLGKLKLVRGKDAGRTVDVAVKLAKLEVLTKEQIKEIMSEARLMRRFDHPNVVKFYGVAALQEPLMVIMELATNGALDSYLQKNKLPMAKLDEMVMQAALGINYIHSKKILHRDIAARNCLYGEGNVKIADFGLSREGDCFQMSPHQRVPIRWLAPEVLTTSFFTVKTDVWAFGILSWEIYHDGQEPYPGMMVADVANGLRNTELRMEFNPSVRPEIASFIKKTVWSDANSRPIMSEVVRQLQSILNMSVMSKSK